MKRRHFLQSSSTFLAGAGIAGMVPSDFLTFKKNIAAADKIRIGAIGINGMGWSDLTSALKDPRAQCIALCDADQNVLDRRVAELAKTNISVSAAKDYRKLLDNKDIDAIIIGTPDHWHCSIMAEACEAGKDVYVEKPAGNSIAECQVMDAAQKKYNRVVQVGQWQRSNKHYNDAMAFVHSGKLGNVRLVKAWAYQGWMKPVTVKPDSTPPPGVDYDRWLGPAKNRPFNENRFPFNFRWFWDYAGGLMTAWGVHMIDYALLGRKRHAEI
jgi:predicted dehydrogenase